MCTRRLHPATTQCLLAHHLLEQWLLPGDEMSRTISGSITIEPSSLSICTFLLLSFNHIQWNIRAMQIFLLPTVSSVLSNEPDTHPSCITVHFNFHFSILLLFLCIFMLLFSSLHPSSQKYSETPLDQNISFLVLRHGLRAGADPNGNCQCYLGKRALFSFRLC